MKIVFSTLAILSILLGSIRADWDLVTYNKMDWVTLRSFCEFYKFPYTSVPTSSPVILKNDRHEITLALDGREVTVDGVRYWLSFSIAEHPKDWLISKIDLNKLFNPVLCPHSVSQWKEWKGVLIDPGHGGDDNGATSRRGKREKNYTLDLGLRLEALLKQKGIPVAMTRRTDQSIRLEERTSIASGYEDYIFLSLHFNDAHYSAKGIETYCLSPHGAGSTDAGGRVTRSSYTLLSGNDNDELNILLATEVHRQLSTLNSDKTFDRGVKRARFVVLKENHLPGILIEGGFLSNRTESAMIDEGDYRQRMAEKILQGIQSFFNLRKPGTSKATPSSKPSPPPASQPPAKNDSKETNPESRTEGKSSSPHPAQKSKEPTPVTEPEAPVIIYPFAPRDPKAELRPINPEPAVDSTKENH